MAGLGIGVVVEGLSSNSWFFGFEQQQSDADLTIVSRFSTYSQLEYFPDGTTTIRDEI
jgi:hypothetical protein